MEHIALKMPLFYHHAVALRLALGGRRQDIWLDAEHMTLNPTYIDAACTRAKVIFDTLFAPQDKLAIVHQILSDGGKPTCQGEWLLQWVGEIPHLVIAHSEHRDLYPEDRVHSPGSNCWHRLTLSNLTVSQIDIAPLLQLCICHRLSRSDGAFQGECYLLNHSSGVVYHIYDDCGLDLVAKRVETLLPVYQKYYDWLLKCDLEMMDRTFMPELLC